MAEQELKLHVPRGSRHSLERELRSRPVKSVRLRARYFDTPNRALVKARVALRVRQEGRAWIQTLKMPGDHALSRIELNHPRPDGTLDLGVYAGTPAQAILAALEEPLGVCYETDVRRVLRLVRTRFGTVEVAYDSGVLRAGALELPISEVEFELVRGRLAAIFSLGRRWQQAHGLIVDARSKSERGDLLAMLDRQLAAIAGTDESCALERSARIAAFWGPAGAEPIALDSSLTPAQALRQVTFSCLEQIVRNTAVLAEIDSAGFCRAGTPEHVHQLRVGIRRLRSAWSLFKGITPLPPDRLQQEIRPFFGQLGGTRDDDVLRDALLPLLTKAGLPPLDFGSAPLDEDGAASLAASRAFQGWLLDLMAWTLDAEPQPPTPAVGVSGAVQTVATADGVPLARRADDGSKPVALRAALRQRLHRWHRRILRDGLRFAELDEESRHQLRKRVKRLRYGLQFAESLLPSVRLKAYRKRLGVVQDILGDMNDLAVGFTRFEQMREHQPSAWFACGWIRSRLETLTGDACEAFGELSHARHFWD